MKKQFFFHRFSALHLSLLAIVVSTTVLMVGTAFMQRPAPTNNFPWYLVDDGDRGFFQTGGWRILKDSSFPGFAFDQRYIAGRESPWIERDPGNALARWTFQLPKPGAYDVFMTWNPPSSPAEREQVAYAAPFVIFHTNGTDTVEVDQSVQPEGEQFGGPVIGPTGSRVQQRRPFQLLGSYDFGKTAVVEIYNTGVDGAILADAIFVRAAKVADLQLALTVGSTSTKNPNPDYKPGSAMQYTYSVMNRGPSAATNVTLVGQLPNEFILSTAIDKRCKISGRDIVCTIPGISAKRTATIKVRGTISKTAACDTGLTARGDVGAKEKDPNPSNNTEVVTDIRLCRTGSTTGSGGGGTGGGGGSGGGGTVPVDPNGADLSITVASNVPFTVADAEVDYTATIRNKGGKDAKDVGVNISVNPFWEKLTYITDPRCTTNNGQAFCRFDLAKGASTVITYSTRTNSIFTCVATSATSVDVRSALNDPYDKDNHAGLAVPKNCPELPHVLMTMTSEPTPQAAPGTEVTFKTIVYNQGFNSEVGRAGEAKNIRFRMKFPCFAFRGGACITNGWETLRLIESDSRCTLDAKKDMTCTVPNLKWGDKAEFSMKVRVDKAGCANDIVTSYEVLGKDGNVTIQPPTNSWSVGVNCSAVRGDMELISVNPPSTVAQNGVMNHQLRLTNKGQKTSDTWVHMYIPSAATVIESSIQGCEQVAVGSASVGCYLGNVNPGDVKNIRVSFRSQGACGSLHVSNATIGFGAENQDDNLSNNTTNTSTTVTCN